MADLADSQSTDPKPPDAAAMPQPSTPSDDASRNQQGTGSARWPRSIIGLLVALFLVTLWQRDTIRAHWWASRLMMTDDLAARGQYLAYLATVGERADGAVRRLARDDRPDVRLLAVFSASKLPPPRSYEMLGRLLWDDDADVRDAAARALVFDGDEAAIKLLCTASINLNEAVVESALAALARGSDADAAQCILAALYNNRVNLRAQAAESAAIWIESADECEGEESVCTRLLARLIELLADQAALEGTLAMEREVARAEEFVRTRHPVRIAGAASDRETNRKKQRTVAEVAAAGLTRLAGHPVTTSDVHTEEARHALLTAIMTRRGEIHRVPVPTSLPINWLQNDNAGETDGKQHP